MEKICVKEGETVVSDAFITPPKSEEWCVLCGNTKEGQDGHWHAVWIVEDKDHRTGDFYAHHNCFSKDTQESITMSYIRDLDMH